MPVSTVLSSGLLVVIWVLIVMCWGAMDDGGRHGSG